MSKSKRKKCLRCKKNSRWKHHKKGLLDVCKKCYHKYDWTPPKKKKNEQPQEEVEDVYWINKYVYIDRDGNVREPGFDGYFWY